MAGKGSARAWLQGLSAEAASRHPEDDVAEQNLGLEEFLDTAPPAARASLGEFLVGQGTESLEALHGALGACGPDGLPQILDRGRSRLISGVFTHLRAACERAGGLQRGGAVQCP